MRVPKEAAFDFSFYAPYKAAVETAFLSLCAARMQLEEEHTPFAVRSMTFRLKSPASIREKLLHYFALCSHRQASDTFSLPLSMSALAEYICADRSAMTREMSRLKKEGILSVQGRKITLHSSHE